MGIPALCGPIPTRFGASLRQPSGGWEDFLEKDPSPAKELIFAANPSMTDDFFAFSREALKEGKFANGDPALGEKLGLITRRRMQEQVDLFVKLKVIDAPVPPDEFVSFDFLPPELAVWP